MTEYVDCDAARDLLDGLVDGELTMAEQLAVDSHLRWCRTCAMRVEDMRLIGASLRIGAAGSARRDGDDRAVAIVHDAVLTRVRAEREQSFGVRLRDMLSDMRFLWPAVGATVAVALCASVAAGVLQASTAEQPQSLAALIDTLANPGSEQNPLRPNNGISIPQLYADDAKRAGGTLDQMPEEDVIYTIRTVVSRDGRVSNYELLLSDAQPATLNGAGHDRAVLDAVQQSRFEPAYTPLGRAVAVDMVWVIAKTTAVVGPQAHLAPRVVPAVAKPRTKDLPKLPEVDAAKPAPSDQQSGTRGELPTA
jgi:hypothetical protein